MSDLLREAAGKWLRYLRALSVDMHAQVLELGQKPGREAHCNTVSREAAKVDEEVAALDAALAAAAPPPAPGTIHPDAAPPPAERKHVYDGSQCWCGETSAPPPDPEKELGESKKNQQNSGPTVAASPAAVPSTTEENP